MRLRDALATVIAATLFLDGCATTPNNPAFEAGKAQAQEDIAKGVLAIEQAGWPMRYDQEYVRLLKRKYGIEVRRVATASSTRMSKGTCAATTRLPRRRSSAVSAWTASQKQSTRRKRRMRPRHERAESPNQRPALDAGTALGLHFGRHWPG